ncbi:hypothetical protein [Pseudobdellovibrio exovorus]|uniref:Uncharacterized protein n=1 Tax=Pseudobdellovibrio exovorus JSS TaxID=1184267 RepID=M4V5G5_9BACT|nr:hypothetical protein [Pseudobdellovibrio exovorus]AGH94577.1 hypothetical protein A11Q_357 [Pseudobdellovibrio exovorus JSS]
MKKRAQAKKTKTTKKVAKKKAVAKASKSKTKTKSKAKPKSAAKTKIKSAKKIKSTAKKSGSPKRGQKKIPLIAPSEFLPQTPPDPSKKPGHRTLNLKDNFQERSGAKTHTQESANQYMSRAEQIRRTSRTNRRVITGAAIGKTGRIVTEKV